MPISGYEVRFGRSKEQKTSLGVAALNSGLEITYPRAPLNEFLLKTEDKFQKNSPFHCSIFRDQESTSVLGKLL